MGVICCSQSLSLMARRHVNTQWFDDSEWEGGTDEEEGSTLGLVRGGEQSGGLFVRK
jgi:hypothetical protein